MARLPKAGDDFFCTLMPGLVNSRTTLRHAVSSPALQPFTFLSSDIAILCPAFRSFLFRTRCEGQLLLLPDLFYLQQRLAPQLPHIDEGGIRREGVRVASRLLGMGA